MDHVSFALWIARVLLVAHVVGAADENSLRGPSPPEGGDAKAQTWARLLAAIRVASRPVLAELVERGAVVPTVQCGTPTLPTLEHGVTVSHLSLIAPEWSGIWGETPLGKDTRLNTVVGNGLPNFLYGAHRRHGRPLFQARC